MTNASPLRLEELPGDLRRAFEWIQNGLTHFTYKPTWHFSLGLRGVPLCPRFSLVANYRAPNADGSGEVDRQASYIISLRDAEYACQANDTNTLLLFVEQVIHRAETHEHEEWLRVDGQRVHAPHVPA